LAKTSEKLAEVYRILDRRLDKREYIVGKKFFSRRSSARHLRAPFFREPVFSTNPELPKLQAWHQRMHSQPGFQKHVNVPLE